MTICKDDGTYVNQNILVGEMMRKITGFWMDWKRDGSMLGVMLQKLWHKKWMVVCLLLGIVLLCGNGCEFSDVPQGSI